MQPSSRSRILLRTSNSGLWHPARAFRTDFVYLAADGADWMVDRGVQLVGIDYLSIEGFGVEGAPTHHRLLGAAIASADAVVVPTRAGGVELSPALPTLEIIPAKTEKFDDVRDRIRRGLLLQKAQQSGNMQRVDQRISQLRQQAQIEVDIEQYKNAEVFKKQPAAGLPTAPGLPPGAAPPTVTPGTGSLPTTPAPGTPAPPVGPPAKNTPMVTPPAGKR